MNIDKNTPIKQIMTKNVDSVRRNSPVIDAAKLMRNHDIGSVLVTENDGSICGVVTDRDIVVRGLAQNKDLNTLEVGDVCSSNVEALAPDATVDQAVQIMKSRAIRRLPVVENGKPVGLVSIGDLAQARDPGSALGEISHAPPNR